MKTLSFASSVLIGVTLVTRALALDVDPQLPAYKPAQLGSAEIKSVGSDTMGDLALYYAKKGDAKHAADFIQRARAIDKRDVGLLYNQAIVENLAGKPAEAVATLREALGKGYSVNGVEKDPEFQSLQSRPDFQAMMLPALRLAARGRAGVHRRDCAAAKRTWPGAVRRGPSPTDRFGPGLALPAGPGARPRFRAQRYRTGHRRFRRVPRLRQPARA